MTDLRETNTDPLGNWLDKNFSASNQGMASVEI